MNKHESYDFFISYKSENSDVARAVAEAIKYNGFRVWFAEYEILTRNYDFFQKEIDRGIEASRYAIIFTNEDWARSQYCQLEIARIMQCTPYERIFQIRIPTHPEPDQLIEFLFHHLIAAPQPASNATMAPEDLDFVCEGTLDVQIAPEKRPSPHLLDLGQIKTMVWDDSIKTALAFLSENNDDDWTLTAAPSPPELKPRWWFSFRSGISLNQKGFVFEPVKEPGGYRAAMFRADVDEQLALMSLEVSTFETAVAAMSLPTEQATDDRAIYGLYRKHAQKWLAEREARETGLHLFHHEVGNHSSSFALTYSVAESDGINEIWQRNYVFRFSPDGVDDVGEANLKIGLRLPKDEHDSNLARFCRYTAYFESIAKSFEYDPPLGSRLLSSISWMTPLALMSVSLYAWFWLESIGSAQTWKIIAAACSGMFVSNFVAMFFSKRLRSVFHYAFVPNDQSGARMTAYQTFSTYALTQATASVVWCVCAVCRGTYHWFGVIPVAIGIALAILTPAYFMAVAIMLFAIGSPKIERLITRKATRV